MTFEEQYHIWKSFHDLMVLEKRIEEVKDEIPPKNNDFIGIKNVLDFFLF